MLAEPGRNTTYYRFQKVAHHRGSVWPNFLESTHVFALTSNFDCRRREQQISAAGWANDATDRDALGRLNMIAEAH